MNHFGRGWRDLSEAIAHWELWTYLGLQDIKLRYRRSVLGPFWITLSMGITIVGVGILYAKIMHTELRDYFPYFTVGFILWNYIAALITEGSVIFINDGGYIRQVPGPLLTYVLRATWRSIIIFVHNFIIFFAVMAYLQIWSGWGYLLAVVGFALVTINCAWIALLTGIISARYRDIPQIVASFMGVLFFLTPVLWQSNQLKGRFFFIEYNPFYHFLEVVRDPLLNVPLDPRSWVMTGALAVLGWTFALLFLGRYHRRIAYWV